MQTLLAMHSRFVLVTSLGLFSLCLLVLFLRTRAPVHETIVTAPVQTSEEQTLAAAMKITEFCTRIRSYAPYLAAERDRGVPYSVVIVQFPNTQSMHAGIPAHHAAEIARMLVDSVYRNPDLLHAQSYDFWEACHRAAQTKR